jgi:hypothetical protein
MNSEDWKITASWTMYVDWSQFKGFVFASDENDRIDGIEEQFQKSEDKTSIAIDMLASIGIKV